MKALRDKSSAYLLGVAFRFFGILIILLAVTHIRLMSPAWIACIVVGLVTLEVAYHLRRKSHHRPSEYPVTS